MENISKSHLSNTEMLHDSGRKTEWVNQNLVSTNGAMPFSFTYAGQSSSGLLKTWNTSQSDRDIDAQRTEYNRVWTDPETGLVVRCVAVAYHDFPTVEWTVYFKNAGAKDTPIIEDIQALDACWGYKSDGSPVLHHHAGSPSTPNDYQPHRTLLDPKTVKRITTSGGRSSHSDFPYFNVEWSGEGLIVVVGWPGQWAAQFTADAKEKGQIGIRAGQELTHFLLHPGEEVRTPLIVLQFWKGDRIRSQNIWRRWMRACNMPRPGGKEIAPLSACCDFCYCPGGITSAAGEKEYLDRYLEEDVKPDWWWQDAGWYVNDGDWGKTGTWETDKQRFPDGLRGVTDYAHSKGMKTIVWFEPERVSKGTWLAKEHPEWILWADKAGGNGLLDLGNPEAWNWLVNHIDKFLTREGIDHYRQDFNMEPLKYWRANDALDRQGITEIKHVTGYLAFWDELLHRHPGMLIDTCASGGRRNDLETLRRSVPLLRSDYTWEPIGMQCQTYGLSFWVPYFGGFMVSDDPYMVRSDMTPFIIMSWDMKKKLAANAAIPTDWGPKTPLNTGMLRKLMGQWRAIAGYYLGDYYPFTSYNLEDDAWMAWQFDRPDLGEGMLQVFRRAHSPFESAVFKLQGLEASAKYGIMNLDTPDITTEMTGKQLMESGLKVVIEQAPQALVFVYNKR